MKRLFISLVIVGVWTASESCEQHRRLEELRQQAESRRLAANRQAELLRELARRQLVRDQERAKDEVINSIRRSRQSYGLPYDPTRGPTVHLAGELPSNSKFCPGSDVYFCPTLSRCSNETGSWRCISTRPVITHYTSRSYRPPSSGSRFNVRPNIRQDPTNRLISCRHGFKLSQSRRSCEDIDECAEREICNGTHEICRNYHGGYGCICERGYTKVSGICVARDRCSSDEGLCNGTNEICKNHHFPGRYYCLCERGYRRVDGQCVDFDECSRAGVCGIANCINSPGSFRCECPAGYRETARYSGRTDCQDINECENTPCRTEEICFNTWGSYSCDPPHICPHGYVKKSGSTANAEVCILEEPELNTNLPSVITYRKIMVPAKAEEDPFHALGTVNFRSPNLNYIHNFYVETEEGEEDFRISERMTRYGSNDNLQIWFYNRGPLAVGEELLLKLKVTDSPRRRTIRYHYDSATGRYSYPDPLPKVSRIVSMTIVPGTHGQ